MMYLQTLFVSRLAQNVTLFYCALWYHKKKKQTRNNQEEMPIPTAVCRLCEQKYVYREGKLRLCPACATGTNLREVRLLRHHLTVAAAFRVPATLTLRQWLATLEHFSWKCSYCQKRPYEYLEHFIPLIKDDIEVASCSLVGGTTIQNCIPACNKCNSCKGRHSPEYIWKVSNGIEQGMFPTLAMIERINRYLQIDLNQKAAIHIYAEDMKAFRDTLRSDGL